MTSGPELAASERRVVESHDRNYPVRNHNVAARFAIQLSLDEPVRSWNAAFEMHELAELRRDFSARVARRCRSHA